MLVPTLLILDKIVVSNADFPFLNVFQDEHPEAMLTMDVPEPPLALHGQPAADYLAHMKKTVYAAWSSRRIITLQRCLRGHIARRSALAFLRQKLKIRNAITVGMSVRLLGGVRDGLGDDCRRLIKALGTAFGSGQRALLDTLPSLDDEDLWSAKRSCDVYADPRQAYVKPPHPALKMCDILRRYFLQQLLEFAAPQQHDMGWSSVSVWRRSLRWVGSGSRIGGDSLLRMTHCFAKRPFMWLRSRPSLKMVGTISTANRFCFYVSAGIHQSGHQAQGLQTQPQGHRRLSREISQKQTTRPGSGIGAESSRVAHAFAAHSLHVT